MIFRRIQGRKAQQPINDTKTAPNLPLALKTLTHCPWHLLLTSIHPYKYFRYLLY